MNADTLNGLANVAPVAVVTLIVRATILLLIAALITSTWRSTSAAVRHAVWAASFAGVLALPLLGSVLPSWRVPVLPVVSAERLAMLGATVGGEAPGLEPAGSTGAVPEALGSAAVQARPSESVTARASEAVGGLDAPGAPSNGQEVIGAHNPVYRDVERFAASWHDALPTPGSEAFSRMLMTIWLAGALLVMLPLVVGRIQLMRIARGARPVCDGRWAALANALSRDMNLRRPVKLLEHEGAVMPMTWGISRPVVLVPAWDGSWTDRCRRDVLAHELAHVERHDTFTQLLAQLACALLWFHPLAWFGARQLRAERERACDDRVLAIGARATEYARHLLDVASSLRPLPATGAAGLSMARRRQIEGRLLALLDSRRSHGPIAARDVTACLAGSLALAVALVVIAPGGANASSSTSSGDTATMAALVSSNRADSTGAVELSPEPLASALLPIIGLDSAVIAAIEPMAEVATPFIPEATAPTSAGSVTADPNACWLSAPAKSRTTRHAIHEDGNGKRTTVSFDGSGCRLELVVDGEYDLSRDLSDLGVRSGSRATITERSASRTRNMEITPTSRRWYVDGTERPVGDDARTWLRAALAELNNETGFAAEKHAELLLETGGMPALMAHMRGMEGGSTIRRYVTAARASGRVAPEFEAMLVSEIAPRISSDHERANLLIEATTRELRRDLEPAYVEAVRTMKSDYERRRTLTPFLARQGLSSRTLAATFDVAATMRSDYERAELLRHALSHHRVGDEAREAFTGALARISSDYELRRTLMALLARSDSPAATQVAMLESAARIRSDYEKAEFLMAFSRAVRPAGDVQRAFERTLGTIRSAHEMERVTLVYRAATTN